MLILLNSPEQPWMHGGVWNHVTGVSNQGNKDYTRNLCGKEEVGRNSTEETEKTVHHHVDKEQDDEKCKESSGIQVETHHKVRADFKQENYKAIMSVIRL